MAVQDILNEREEKYGDFNALANAIQAFKSVYRASPSWKQMTAVQRESLEMEIVKNCRILYGDPMHEDSWIDKCGYAMLATEEFTKSRVKKEPMDPPMEPKHPIDLEDTPPKFLRDDSWTRDNG